MTNTETCNSRVLDEASKVIDHEKRGLYDPRYEHDNCGIGSIVNIKGNKTHDTVSGALDIVEKLEHRAGKDAEGKTGDGVGILLQISHNSLKRQLNHSVLNSEMREITVSECFSFHRMNLKETVPKRCLKSLLKRRGLNFSAGEKFLLSLKY